LNNSARHPSYVRAVTLMVDLTRRELERRIEQARRLQAAANDLTTTERLMQLIDDLSEKLRQKKKE
jgi:hypothetical protein